jgi:hypothetical protein
MNYIIIGLILVLLILMFIHIGNVVKETFIEPYEEIDAFIYINLENREDRKKEILAEFEKIEVPTLKIRKISGVRIPKNGHKGCIQSHILALQMAKMNNWNRVAIFEDDATLNVNPDEFKSVLNKALELEKNKWDVIMISGCNKEKREQVDNDPDMYYLNHATCGTAYIIKKSYYDTLLNLFIHCNDMMSPDNWEIPNSWEGHALDQQWNKLIKRDKWIAFNTDLMVQRGSHSSINGEQKD